MADRNQPKRLAQLPPNVRKEEQVRRINLLSQPQTQRGTGSGAGSTSSSSSSGTGATGPQGPAGVGVPTGGTAGQVLTKNSATNYDTVWQTPSSSSGAAPDQNRLYYFEDFISGLNVSGQIGALGWSAGGTGGAFGFTTGMAAGTYRGVASITSNNAWEFLYLCEGNASLQWVNPADTSVKFKARVTPMNATQGKHRLGLFVNTGSQDPSDGIYFERSGSGNWMAVTRASASETSTDTGLAYATGVWHTLEIDIAGSKATFKVDGTAVVSNQSTNFPTAWLIPAFQVAYVNSAQASMDIDYCLIDITPAVTR